MSVFDIQWYIVRNLVFVHACMHVCVCACASQHNATADAESGGNCEQSVRWAGGAEKSGTPTVCVPPKKELYPRYLHSQTVFLCGAVTHHMKPPEPQCGFSLLYVCMHVYVCVCLCVWGLGYALLSGDKYSLVLDVAWGTPASNSCRPQQWDQDCFGDIQWQQCPDTENGLKHEQTSAERMHKWLDWWLYNLYIFMRSVFQCWFTNC